MSFCRNYCEKLTGVIRVMFPKIFSHWFCFNYNLELMSEKLWISNGKLTMQNAMFNQAKYAICFFNFVLRPLKRFQRWKIQTVIMNERYFGRYELYFILWWILFKLSDWLIKFEFLQRFQLKFKKILIQNRSLSKNKCNNVHIFFICIKKY